jgi:glycine cleavage system H protein
MKFTESHEWINLDLSSDIATVGVSNYAQNELGEIVYVELPTVGKSVKAGGEVAVLESTKAAADVYSPVSGTIVEVNKQLSTASELVNKSPEKEGWIYKIKLTDKSEIDTLMDETTYKAKHK